MSSKHDKRVVLRNMPYRPGLATAGQQSTIPETEAWQLTETFSDLDGMVMKRPGLTQWGQTIKRATVTDSGITAQADFLKDLAGFVTTDNGGDPALISYKTKQGSLRTSVNVASLPGSGENVAISYTVPVVSTGAEASLRFNFRGTNLPVYGDDTANDSFTFKVQGSDASCKEFGIWAGGLYWLQDSDSKYVLVTGSELIGNGPWVTIEVRVDDAGGNTTVYMNDTLLETLTSADLKTGSTTGTSAFEFRWEVDGSGDAGTQYTTYIAQPMYSDTITDPFEVVPIVAVSDYQYVTNAGSDVRCLLAAAGSYIYHDNGLQGLWRPLLAKVNKNVYFARYRTNIVWSDNNGASTATIWMWDGRIDPKQLKDAPSVRFLVEHQQRLLGWGDTANPRRLYYSADRQPDKWFSPSPSNVEDQFEVAIEAGYQELPSKAASVTAVWGDYYGLAVIFAEQGVWKMTGNGVFSYRVQGITLKNGAINADSITQVGNDIWALSRQGIISLQASEQYGDLKVGYPSGPIQNLWASDISTDTSINQTFITRSKMVFNARDGNVIVATPSSVQQQPGQVHVYNANTQKWFGPWAIDAHALADAVVASPVTEIVVFGDQDGRIGYLNSFDKSDYGAEYTTVIMPAAFDGRSVPEIGGAIKGMVKIWKTLRLFTLPRGDFNYVVTWWVDDKPQEQTRTRSQISTNEQYLKVLDDNFRLDLTPDGLLQSGETAITHDIPLDARGKWLTFKIEQDGVGQDLALQGFEIEALVAGYEEE